MTTITVDVEALQPVVAKLKAVADHFAATFAEPAARVQALAAQLALVGEEYRLRHERLFTLLAERPLSIPAIVIRRTNP